MDMLPESHMAMIQEWNAVTLEAVESCIHSEIQLQTLHHPEAPAIKAWDGEATYNQLDQLSLRLAQRLCRLGVGLESVVVVSFEKSAWAVVAMLAVLRAGGAVLSLDPYGPRGRWESILTSVTTEVILVSRSTAEVFAHCGKRLVVVSGSALQQEDYGGCNWVPPEVSPRHAAFVLFTSGSTGRPKGLVQDHRAVCTMNEAYTDALNMSSHSRVFQFAAYTFDASTVDIFHTLMHGGCVCIPSEHDRRDNIVRSINELGANWANLTPSFAATLNPDDVPKLQTLVLAGEKVTQAVLRRWIGKVKLINCYGPAEAGACTAHEYKSINDDVAIIGRPIKRFACWVVESDCIDRLAPIGSVGELLVEGPSLARGYLNNEEKTRESFTGNPAWYPLDHSDRQSRFYRTGDLVAYRPDGALEFIGRHDSQIKVRGQRVEAEEVEMLLEQSDAVYRSVVAFPSSGPYCQQLVAVVQPVAPPPYHATDAMPTVISRTRYGQQASEFALDGVFTYLNSRVPTYMLPTSWILVENIPVTTSFKIDRKSVCRWLEELPLDYLLTDYGCMQQIPADNTVARKIGDWVAGLLSKGSRDLEKSLRGKDFVLSAFGMDSIQAMSLARWIVAEFSATVSAELLTNRDLSIVSLAAEVEKSSWKLHGASVGGSQPDLMSEVRSIGDRLSREFTVHVGGVGVQCILLTGATGFLGMQILRECLAQPSVHKVVALVRAMNAEEGRERIVREARKRHWWSDSFQSSIEIWVGDLELPRLGLSEEQWNRVVGRNCLSGLEIHGIIHNGANVAWNRSYYGLKKANTISTLQLLNVMASSSSCHRFVYVSGGQRLSFGDREENALVSEATFSTGYTKSKLVSELLIKNLADESTQNGKTLRIVKPSYIIGSCGDTQTNTRDYLWRFIATAIEIQSYNVDEDEYWLFLSDVDHVAATVVENTIGERKGQCTTKSILDGIRMKDLWSILSGDFGYRLKPLVAAEWWKRIREHVVERGDSHSLWPLLDVLIEGKGNICFPEEMVKANTEACQSRIEMAVRMNIKRLLDIGFFPDNNY